MFRRFLESVDDALVVLEQTRRIRAVVRSDLNHGIGHKSFPESRAALVGDRDEVTRWQWPRADGSAYDYLMERT